MEKTLKYIKDNGFKVKSKKKTLSYINKYGDFRLIEGYGSVLKKYIAKPTTKQLILLFEFDTTLSALMSKYILDFEKILNNVAIQTILQLEDLEQDYVLDIVKNPAHSNLKNKGYGTFVNDIYENIDSCDLLASFPDKTKIPLKALSVSWSFHTIIAFINLQSQNVKTAISSRFRVTDCYDEFISACHSIRKFRNTISHNGIFLSTTLDFYCQQFNYLLNRFLNKNHKPDSPINVIKLIELLEYFLDTNLKSEILKHFKHKDKITKKILSKICD